MDVFVFIDAIDTTTGDMVTGPLPSSCFKCWSCPETTPGKWRFQVPYDWIYPLQSCEFANRTVKCPAQSASYLGKLYGNDFLTPAYDYE